MFEQIVLWTLYAFIAYLMLPILLCWLLFGIAQLKGWSDPHITPAQIIKRLLP